MQKEIPVVTTTDEAYLLNCYVAVYSIIKSASPDNIYKVYILVSDLSQESCEKLESLSVEHVSVRCLDISDITENVNLQQTGMFPVQTYYRLFITIILPEYKKILYLDSDMCILHDVADLYDMDLEGHVIGVVQDVPCEHLEIHGQELGGLDCRKTFNSGVLLMDTEAFEKEHIREKCLELLSDDYSREERKLIYEDNDALNVVLYDQCKILEDAWNFQWQYIWRIDEVYEDFRGRYKGASVNPYIIHYAGGIKPWTNPDFPMAEIFWKLAGESSIYQEIVFKALIDARRQKEKMGCYKTFVFPYDQVPYGSRIAVYAAGKVGQAFYNQMQISGYAEIVLWIDKNYEFIQDVFPVEPPYLLVEQQDSCDYVVIAIEKEEIAKEISAELGKQGIPKEKLVWAQYKKHRR